jgi:branched-chain amino acid transport system permease protein
MTFPSLHILLNALASGILLGGLLAVTAVGLSLIFGVMRLINLAHGELLVLGAYLAFTLAQWFGLDPLVSLLIVAPVVFVVALPVFKFLLAPVLHRGPEPAMLTTFAVSIIAQSLFIIVFSADVRRLVTPYASAPLNVLGLNISVIYLISFVIGVALCFGLDQLVRRTSFGRDLRATAEDSDAASALGVNISRTNLLVFAVAAACASIGGVLVGMAFSFSPSSGLTYLLTGFAVVVLGGLGSIRGTLIGAILIGIVQSVGGAIVGDGYRDIIGFVVFLVVLSFRPQGLFGRKVLA